MDNDLKHPFKQEVKCFVNQSPEMSPIEHAFHLMKAELSESTQEQKGPDDSCSKELKYLQ